MGTKLGIGKRLREYRNAVGIKNLTQLAKIIGISHGSLSDIENEKTSPHSETLQKIVRNTDINPRWLLIGKGPMVSERSGEPLKLADFLPPIPPNSFSSKEAKAIKYIIEFLIKHPESADPIRDSIDIASSLQGRPWERKAYLDILKAIKVAMSMPHPPPKKAIPKKEHQIKKDLKRSIK